MKQYFDVALIAPLQEEFEQALTFFDFKEDLSTSATMQFRLTFGELSVLLVKQNDMGRTAAQQAVAAIDDQFDVGLYICVGICGGISDDVAIGDVIVSQEIVDVLDNQKATQPSGRKTKIKFSPTTYKVDSSLSIAFHLNMLAHGPNAAFDAWREERYYASSALLRGEFHGRANQLESIEVPRARVGVVCCGMVSASSDYNEALRALNRRILAIETESGGVFSEIERRAKVAITVRAVSDYADIDKSRFERETGGRAREYAAGNAWSFIRHQLASATVIAWLAERRTKVDGEQLPLLPAAAVDPLTEIVRSLYDQAESKLRERAPAFALQTRGYRLPVPRLRIQQGEADEENDEDWQAEVDVRDALRSSRVLVVVLPKDYPDRSVSWIFSSSLLLADHDGKQLLPVVVDAAALQKTSVGLRAFLQPEAEALATEGRARLVFVVDEFGFESKAKCTGLLKYINEWPDAAFVVITRNRSGLLAQSDLLGKSAAKFANICDVPFSEIAFFVQKNYEMQPSESEVIASRLRDLFERFNLPSHPSYFAGLSRDTLAALLSANRRGELIQLAVVGYLSFVVAGDTQPIPLSRTTRENFLTELAVQMNLEKRSFSAAELAAFAAEFVARFDYKVSAIAFVSAFLENGLLHFQDDKVKFTLPFVEAYVLSKDLHAHPHRAESVFKLGDGTFNFPAFALYSEFGAAPSLIATIQTALANALQAMTPEGSDAHILVGNKVAPAMLAKRDRVATVQRRLRQAVVDVRADRDETHEKQRMLDFADRMHKNISSRAAEITDKPDEKKSAFSARLVEATESWSAGLCLLSGGAERLEAAQKRELASRMTKLTAAIMNEWTRLMLRVPFDEIKREMVEDEAFIATVAKSRLPEDLEDARRFAREMADLMEYILLANPFRVLLSSLCEEARDKVLAVSIAHTSHADPMEELVHSLWLCDVDVETGRGRLLKAIKSLPNELFLRITLASHLMMRVHWSHWRKEDRLGLLDMAREALVPLNPNFDTGKMRRQIEADERD